MACAGLFDPCTSSSITIEVGAAGTPPTHIKLKLKRRRSRVRWAEEVVDNEDLCRKKSKCCCVYHRPRGLDDSSGDEDDGGQKDAVPCRRGEDAAGDGAAGDGAEVQS